MNPFSVTVDEFCRLVGIKRTTAFRLIAEGAVTKVKIGGRTLITLDSIERLIERSAVGMSASAPVSSD